MPQICLYLHLHQPYRLSEFSVEELGTGVSYFFPEKDLNREVFEKVTQKSYLPMLHLLQKLVTVEPTFRVSFSITGLWVEQAERYAPELIGLLRSIVNTGRAEILAETYYHSLASLFSPTEFAAQVAEHMAMVKDRFDYVPTTFRNTELVYSNDVAKQVANLGYAGILTEGVDRVLHGRPLTQVYYSIGEEQLPILLKHAQLSDDVAFRFSDKSWQWHPLSAERYLEWVERYGEDELVNLFMDFETFGEHQWADTGIFQFFESFVRQFSAKSWNSFVMPSEVFEKAGYAVRHGAHNQVQEGAKSADEKSHSNRQTTATSDTEEHSDFLSRDTPSIPQSEGQPRKSAPPELRYDVPTPISWADVDRDLTAWLENAFQQDCIEQMYELETDVLSSKSPELIADWRRLQASDHYYYMCTKWSADGDVHAYFSPYKDPFEAYRRFSIILADIKHRLWAMRLDEKKSHLLAPPHLRSD